MASQRELDLLLTCREGHTDAVLDILNAAPEYKEDVINVNTEDSLGETALHICAEHGHANVMRVLLERGADCCARTICGWTPLHLAASCPCTGHKGHVQAVQLLLAQQQHQELLSAVTNDGRSALHIASLYGFTDVVRVLLQAGANPNVQDQDGITPFAVACQSHTLDCIQTYLDMMMNADMKNLHNFDPTNEIHWLSEDKDGYTPLHLALQEQRYDEVRLWLNCNITTNAWMNHQAKNDGCTPLHAAVAHAKKAVPWLLQAGANPASADAQGWTAWHWAADEGHLGVWQTLIGSNGASVKSKITTMTPWHEARTTKGETCLHIASQAGNDILCERMLQDVPLSSSLVQARITKTGQTALHVACLTRQPAAVVRVLGQAGVPLQARCLRGLNALQMAKQRRQYDALYLMIHFCASAGHFCRGNNNNNNQTKEEKGEDD